MKRVILFILLLCVVFVLGISGSKGTKEDKNGTIEESSETGAKGTGEEKTEKSDAITSETNISKLDINESDIESLTVDEVSGEPCNDYIPTLLDTGIASYVISPNNTIFDYFCSQTIGGEDYEELDLVGDTVPSLNNSYFINVHVNGNAAYESITHLAEDVYIACSIEVDPSEPNEFAMFGCNLSTIDSHEYFHPVKKYTEPVGDEFPDVYFTDTKILDNMYSEYVEDFDNFLGWYNVNGYKDLDGILNNVPPKSELNLQVVPYDTLINAVIELQDIVKADYEQ